MSSVKVHWDLVVFSTGMTNFFKSGDASELSHMVTICFMKLYIAIIHIGHKSEKKECSECSEDLF